MALGGVWEVGRGRRCSGSDHAVLHVQSCGGPLGEAIYVGRKREGAQAWSAPVFPLLQCWHGLGRCLSSATQTTGGRRSKVAAREQ